MMYKKFKNELGHKIELPVSVWEQIKLKVDEYYPKECGGVFVGRIVNSDTAFVEDVILPKYIKSSPVLFTRVASFINNKLKEYFKKNRGSIIYLGEWHSHPNGSPFPSQIDFIAMKSIVKKSNVRIRTPILLIIGYDKKVYDERFFIYYEDRLIPYKQIELTT